MKLYIIEETIIKNVDGRIDTVTNKISYVSRSREDTVKKAKDIIKKIIKKHQNVMIKDNLKEEDYFKKCNSVYLEAGENYDSTYIVQIIVTNLK